jgi:uncharacterized protein (TIRG00374 family)
MADRRARGAIELGEPVAKTPGDDVVSGTPSLGGRILSLRNGASVLLALVVLYLVYRQFLSLDWREVWTSVRGASAVLFALALVIFYCSFPLRAARWKTLLANVGYDATTRPLMPSTSGLTRIMYVAWFVNCVTIARLGDAYRGYLLKKEAGVSFTVTLGTVLAERLLDLLVMGMMVGVGVVVVFGRSLPTEAAQALIVGLILSGIGAIVLLAMRRFGWAFERVLPKRLHVYYSRLEHGVVDSLRGKLPLLVVYSAAGWVLEGAALYVTAASLGAPVSVLAALVVALAASLLTAVPITPAGLGFTEAGMLVMLQWWLGLDLPTATAVTLLFRIINYWSIVVFGSFIYLYIFARNTNPSADRSTDKERLGLHG